MCSDEEIIASARIVTPEQAARTPHELALLRIALGVSQIAGSPYQIVQFSDGVVAIVDVDPSDAKAWRNALRRTHQAAAAGYIGPVPLRSNDENP